MPLLGNLPLLANVSLLTSLSLPVNLFLPVNLSLQVNLLLPVDLLQLVRPDIIGDTIDLFFLDKEFNEMSEICENYKSSNFFKPPTFFDHPFFC